MAQTDTGLGWSAKDTWLASAGNISVGSISTFSSATLTPIPTGTTIADIRATNLWYAVYKSIYSSCVVEPGTQAYCFYAGKSFVYCSSKQSSSGSTGIYHADWDINSSWASEVTEMESFTLDSTTGLYYGYVSVNISQHNPNLPVYDSISEGLAEISRQTTNIVKDNIGYAVACVAKWKTSAGVIMQSPILISSDTSFVDMSTTGTYQFAKYNTRRDGMKFYMSFYQDISDDITTVLPVYDISGPEDPYANLDELFNLICALDQANVKVTETVDPYEDFPHTEEDTGEVDPDPEDDDIEEADLPTMSFATAGFCRIYRPSFAQVSALASYMWTDQNFLQTVINHLKQILENPIDAIISLSIVPCVPNVLADEEVKVMYVPTGVYMPPVQRQFVEIDCGSYTLKEMYGSALDYNPYTSVQLYLPYVGIVQLDTDEVMGKTLSIGYRIDVVTGVCCAYVKAAGDVLYQFSGHCSIQQPITSADFSGYINAALAAGKLVASIAAAGAGAPAVAATLAGAPTPSIYGSESKTVETERNPNTGRQITVGTRKRESQTYNPGASFGEVATRGVSNTVGAVMNSKTIVQHSGGFSGNSGFMAAVRRPYLIVTRPRIANPENYGKYNGRPSMIYLNLGDCTGFTQVQSIQLTGIDATNPELSEIATLLNSGVIL